MKNTREELKKLRGEREWMRRPPGRGDFWILKIAYAPSPKNLSKNGFCPLKGGSLSDGNRF
jgi:hypothetical protein